MMTSETGKNSVYLLCFAVISIAVVGFFVGLQSPVKSASRLAAPLPAHEATPDDSHADSHKGNSGTGVIPATHYEAIGSVNRQRIPAGQTSVADLNSSFDLMTEVKVTPQQKTFALAMREQNRAFNGAPPTVPHSVDQMSSRACVACHVKGASFSSLRISKMSHQFLANCTQCHVENNPQHMEAVLFRENSFSGLPAPTGGPRAFEGAPPQIPHSTWMRVDCMSCHGFTGHQGLRTTHPWRQNCQQCHAPSSALDQTRIDPEPRFLPPPTVEKDQGIQ